jgi:NAD(P)-dependent dehydrogenase (short-subunit alcohol dehydrogenase family)
MDRDELLGRFDMSDRVVIVTGGSRGIGRAIAERLAQDGAVVGVTYARDETAASETVENIRKNGGRAFALRAGLGERGDAARLWAAFDAAGTEHVPEDAFDKVFAVNVRAPFFVTQQGLPRLRDGGRIINISSSVARLATPGMIAYGATKGALDNFSLALAKELGPRGVTVNSVAPGTVLTDASAATLLGDPHAEAQAASLAAFGRIGRPEDMADIVAFLASDDARWITGQVIDATGGMAL